MTIPDPDPWVIPKKIPQHRPDWVMGAPPDRETDPEKHKEWLRWWMLPALATETDMPRDDAAEIAFNNRVRAEDERIMRKQMKAQVARGGLSGKFVAYKPGDEPVRGK